MCVLGIVLFTDDFQCVITPNRAIPAVLYGTLLDPLPYRGSVMSTVKTMQRVCDRAVIVSPMRNCLRHSGRYSVNVALDTQNSGFCCFLGMGTPMSLTIPTSSVPCRGVDQVFVEREGEYDFVGLWSDIESMNECEALPKEVPWIEILPFDNY